LSKAGALVSMTREASSISPSASTISILALRREGVSMSGSRCSRLAAPLFSLTYSQSGCEETLFAAGWLRRSFFFAHRHVRDQRVELVRQLHHPRTGGGT